MATQLQSLFIDLLTEELSLLNVTPQNVVFANASRKDQLISVSEKWSMSMYLDGALNKYWYFELHFGLFEGQPTLYLYAANEFDWLSFVGRKGGVAELLRLLVSQAVEGLVKPSRMKNSAPWPTSHWLLLPRGFSAQLDSRDNETLAIFREEPEAVVARYFFRDFTLYRSNNDELFPEERKSRFVKIPTHNFEQWQRHDMTPNQWSHLLGAWVSRDFFMKLGYLVEDDSQFRRWGKDIIKFPSKFPWRQRADWRAGLTHWVTKQDLEVKAVNRSNWLPRPDDIRS